MKKIRYGVSNSQIYLVTICLIPRPSLALSYIWYCNCMPVVLLYYVHGRMHACTEILRVTYAPRNAFLSNHTKINRSGHENRCSRSQLVLRFQDKYLVDMY